MVVGFLFLDGSGKTTSWLVLPIIRLEWDAIATYNGGGGVRCTNLVVPFAVRQGLKEWCERQPWRLHVPLVYLVVGVFPGR
jgi:hypothetical protein